MSAVHEPIDVEVTLYELRDASRSLAAAAAKLGRLQKEFDGTADSGEFQAGPGRRFTNAIAVRKVKLYRDAVSASERPPGEEARQAIAEVEIREEEPQMAAEFDRLSTEIFALRQFLSSQKVVINGMQSVLSASKLLSGLEGEGKWGARAA